MFAIPLSLLLAPLPQLAAADGPPRAQARWLDPPPHFVGQAIGIEVTAEGPLDRPALVVPKVATGEIVEERREGAEDAATWTWTLRLVATRPGALKVPPFVVRSGVDGPSVRTQPLSATVRELPATGRSRAFLGGVGAIERIEVEAVPEAPRVGQTFEYRLTLHGGAALSSTTPPGADLFDGVPLGLRVEVLPSRFRDGPPRRTFVFRLRPTRAGEASLPALAVATFDPRSQTYQTRLAPRVAVRVAPAPVFDPNALDYPSPTPPTTPRWVFGALAASGLLVVVWVLVLAGKRLRDARRRDPARLMRRRASALAAIDAPSLLAERVERDLADYLRLAAGRPPGVLTPDEAFQALGAIATRNGLAEKARGTIAACDRVRYGLVTSDEEVAGLRARAIALFRELGDRRGPGQPRRSIGAGQPREDVL